MLLLLGKAGAQQVAGRWRNGAARVVYDAQGGALASLSQSGACTLMLSALHLPDIPEYDHRGAPHIRYSGFSVDIGAYEAPLPVAAPPQHSADRDNNRRFRLSEVLRLIQFFNTDGLHCADPPENTEDGYAPGAGAQDCAPHSGDYNSQDWRINLSELLRVVQIYNSGGYTYCPAADPPTEDGYAPGAGDQSCVAHSGDYNPQDWYINPAEILRLIQQPRRNCSDCPNDAPPTEDGYCPATPP